MDRPFRQPALTALQARVLARHASGRKLLEIAVEEYLSKREMARVSEDLKRRLDAKNLAQATLVAYALGYITLPDEDGIVYSQSMLVRAEKLTD